MQLGETLTLAICSLAVISMDTPTALGGRGNSWPVSHFLSLDPTSFWGIDVWIDKAALGKDQYQVSTKSTLSLFTECIFSYLNYELYKHFFGLWNVAKRTACQEKYGHRRFKNVQEKEDLQDCPRFKETDFNSCLGWKIHVGSWIAKSTYPDLFNRNLY